MWWMAMAWAGAPDVDGTWLSVGDDGCSLEAELEVSVVDGALTASIRRLLEEGRDPAARCVACSGDDKDRPMVGLELVSGLVWDGSAFSGGTVLDPVSGRAYSARARHEAPGLLIIRGYWMIPALGRTVTWLRPEVHAGRCGGR